MDCCNYVPYRHHQGYYGYYNEPLPPYHGEFYGHHNMYYDYYGNINPYYSPHQHWQGSAVFAPQDYVYNPKEARLRKAMREANRDRSIGASPMLPRPSARRAGSSGWVTQGGANVPGGSVASTTHGPHEEPLMMSSMGQGMRGPGMDSPCFPTGMPSTSGSINGSGNEQFMPPSMRAATPAPGYPTTKMDQVSPLPPPPAPTPGVHAPYMQANPLSQLQQQTEMWHNYSDDLRPRSSGNPFMMPDMQAPYHHQPSPPLSIPSPMLIEKHRRTPVHPIHINPISMPMTPPHNSIMSMTPPHSNENVPPDESMHLKDKVLHDNFGQLESKHTIEPSQPLMENNVQQQNEFSSNIYEPNVGFNNSQNHLQHMEKAEEMKMKKIYGCFCHKDVSCKYNLHLPLSCDNFCATPDLYTNDLNYQTNYITNYFNGLPEFEVCNISYEGHCFPCASRINFSEENNSMEDCLPPSFLKTNVGFIPITFGMN
ncbi:uncharacterized protein LOC130900762 isoform X2 [Diorhabda carinulata]|uniref:uncharacterized protein LOC130900762 isoform X2 n=1 Tax=Diorhabda carinulata TaxID=1163345 RepID=UPI00259FE8E6|nr:uncharacterized protein LOC130900762 isoform X2 [Diorhabda carinulata]